MAEVAESRAGLTDLPDMPNHGGPRGRLQNTEASHPEEYGDEQENQCCPRRNRPYAPVDRHDVCLSDLLVSRGRPAAALSGVT